MKENNLTKPTTSYLSNLTPLRGLAALLTVIFHVDLMLGHGGGLLLKFEHSHLISKLYLMVDFFFVLSGFIMMHVYATSFRNAVALSEFKKFSIARFARVYPLHFFTLAYLVLLRIWFFAMGGVDNDPFSFISNSWAAIPTNLLLIQSMNVHSWFSWNNAAWSISTEWWMYMLFPFLVKPLFNANFAGRMAVVVACVGGYFFIMFYIQTIVVYPEPMMFIKPMQLGTLNVGYDWGFLRCLFGFVLGMVAYLGYKDEWGKTIFANGYVFTVLTLASLLCLHFALPDVLVVSFFPFMILAAAYGSSSLNSVLAAMPLQKIGDWSFSIYLVHQPILYTMGTVTAILSQINLGFAWPPVGMNMFTGWMICIAFIAFTLFVSSLTYRFVEVPARKWINKK